MLSSDSFWTGRRVLVTGHTGFKGAWLVALLSELGAEIGGLALAPTDLAGAYGRLDIADRCDSHIVDIRDRAAVASVMAGFRPEIVLHLAAQALVGTALADPVPTFDTNVVGTANVLAEAFACPNVGVVVVVTSDKVYANHGDGRPFVETDSLGGGDPYSASKAATELVVQTWRDNYSGPGSPVVVSARAGNVIGGGDTSADRLLPDLFRAISAGRPLLVRHPASVRPWQFVLEPLAGYLAYAEAASVDPQVPGALNFGPHLDGCWPVAAVADRVIELCGEGSWRHEAAAAEGREATLLRLDPTLAGATIGWHPTLDLDTALAWTAEWHRVERSGGNLSALVRSQIARYRELTAGVLLGS